MIICADGMPFLPAMQLPGATSENAKAMSLNIKKYISNSDTSRLFIMYNDPQWLYKQMDDFLTAKE